MSGISYAEKAGNVWKVTLDRAHAARFKRVFDGVAKFGHEVTISDTPRNAKDLLWFAERYPFDFDPYLHIVQQASLQDDREHAVATILDDSYKPSNPRLSLPIREYQARAVDLCLNTGAILLGDDVGLGKTVTAIGLFARAEGLPAVVVTLTSLPLQWEREVKRFAPELRTHVILSGKPYPLNQTNKGKPLPLPDVILMSYSKLVTRSGDRSWAEVLAEKGYCKTLIFDEGQMLRNNDSERYRAARVLRDAATYCMMCSVGPDSWVELRGGCFGAGWIGPIAEAHQCVSVVASRRPAPDGHVILDTSEMGIEGRGWTGRAFAWKPVLSFVEHTSHGNTSVLRVRGQSLVATHDHSIFIGQGDGSLAEVPANMVRPDDIVPIDNGRDWGGVEEEVIDVVSSIDGMSKAQVVVDLAQTSRCAIGVTTWEWQNFHREAKYGPRLPLSVYLRHRDKLPTPTLVYIGRSRRANTISPTIRLSDWAYILGFFLGDGWIDSKQRVCFAVDLPKVPRVVDELRRLPGLHLNPSIRKTPGASAEVRVPHALFARVLLHVMGKQACHEKSVPGSWVMTWPEAARRELLRGLVDSDGHVRVNNGWRSFVTSSRALCRGVLALLRSLGVPASMLYRKPSKGGVVKGRLIDGKRGSWVALWSPHAEHGDNNGRRGSRHRLPSKGRFFEGVVRSVEQCPRPDRTYDLEMLGHPSFVVDGMLVHNTATPVYNYGGEIHNVIEIVQPGTLGTRTEFLREWCGREGSSESIEREGTGDMRKASVTDPVALGLHLRDCGVYLRRTRADVGRELPSLQRVFHYVEGDDSVKKIEDQIEKLCRTILEGTRDERFEAAGELDWKLRKATGLSKVMEAASFIRLLVEDGEKVLVYGWHHEVYDELMRILRDEKLDGGDLNPALYTGRETQRKKEIERARFMGGPTLAQAKVDYNDARLQETNVMLMSVRAGAGLDGLQFVCSTVVFVELDWSPGVHEQAEGRVYRDGQGLPVMVYYVVINEGSDPVVLDTLNLKTSQSEGIRNLRTDVETLQGADPNKMRALAERWLRDHGKI